MLSDEDVSQFGSKPLLYGYLDSSGRPVAYPESLNASLCFTKVCLKNTVAHFSKDAFYMGFADSAPQVPISREGAMTIALAPLLLVIAPAIVTIAMGWRYSAMCVNLFGFLLVVPLFLIVAVLFPATIAANDTCSSLGSIMISSTGAVASKFCPAYNAVSGECAWQIPELNTTLSLNPTAVVRSIALGQDDNGTDVLVKLWQQVADDMEGVVHTRLQQLLNESLKEVSRNFTDRLLLQEDIAHVAGTIRTAIADFGGVVNGTALHQVYFSFEDAACCKTFGSLFWYAAGWFSIGVCTLCCAIPGGLYGFVRFGKQEQRNPRADRMERAAEIQMAQLENSPPEAYVYHANPEPKRQFNRPRFAT